MSWQASEWMDHLPYDCMKPLATRVLLKLSNVAAQDGTRAWRNLWEVASELGVDRRSVQRALRELQASDLLRMGNQSAVGHIRTDRRPTVYDLNFAWHRMYAQPEIALPDEDEQPEFYGATNGATELSTENDGATNGATATVPLGTNGTSYTQVKEESSSSNHAQARKASNDTLKRGSKRAASATGPCGHDMIDDRHCYFGCLPAELVNA